MSGLDETFFTSVGCMDGRSEYAVAKWGCKKFGVLYADTITEAGLVGLLAKDNVDKSLLDSIKNKITISLEKHRSKGIVVSGHEECAGNPVDEKEHKKDVLKAKEVISSLVSSSVVVAPAFVKRNGAEWVVEEL